MDKISHLRKLLLEHSLDGYIIPMNDEFNCEYVPAHARRLEWLTGFTGSAGSVLVLQDKAIFFTDGRYTLQAEDQLDSKVFEIKISPSSNLESYIENSLSHLIIGYDGKLVNHKQSTKLLEIGEKKEIKFRSLNLNLVDEIWKDKPAENIKQAFIHELKFSGKDFKEKISEIKTLFKADNCFLTLPESICWLLNIRGYDLPHTPFLLSYLLIENSGKCTIFTDERKISNSVKDHFEDKVVIIDLSKMEDYLKQKNLNSIQLDPAFTSLYFIELFNSLGCKITFADDPCLKPKACKNKTELENIRNSHLKDGIALVKFLNWFYKNVNKTTLDELSIADKLESFRQQDKEFFSTSFDTIAGFNSNGAIIHYHANDKTNKAISGSGILLLDSGAQYYSGTTDITRTLSVGSVSDEAKHNFTLVLKGHIALAAAVFAKGTAGNQLDVLARKALWAEQKDYAHGTGHGVGYFLNVHEGPQGISRVNTKPLEAGMLISNEPGFYKNGEYGIRIESLIIAKEISANYLSFETVSLVPIDSKLIKADLLDDSEKTWLNNYHRTVFEKVSPFLNDEEKSWLEDATKEL